MKAILWLGKLIAVPAYFLGSCVAAFYTENVINSIQHSIFFLPWFILSIGIAYVLMVSICCTVGFICVTICRAIREWQGNLASAAHFDLKRREDALIVSGVAIGSTFMCGLFSSVLETEQLALMLTFANTPSILQLIELQRPQQQTSTGTLPANVSDG